MNDQVLNSILTVIINDQAYLHARLESLEYEKKQGFPPDQDVFERWQDEWKEEANRLANMLLEDIVLEELEADGV